MKESDAKHFIQRYVFDVDVDSKADAKPVQDRLSALFSNRITEILSEVFDEYDDPAFITRIDSLELDLGEISESSLETDLAYRFERQLRAILHDVIGEIGRKSLSDTERGQRVPLTPAKIEILGYFLEHGRMPAGAEVFKQSAEAIFRELIENDPEPMVEMLVQVLKRRPAAAIRIVRQFSRNTLELIFKATVPSQVFFLRAQENEILEKVVELTGYYASRVREETLVAFVRYLFSKEKVTFEPEEFRKAVAVSMSQTLGSVVEQAFVAEVPQAQASEEEQATKLVQSRGTIRQVVQTPAHGVLAHRIVEAWEYLVRQEPESLRQVLAEAAPSVAAVTRLLQHLPVEAVRPFVKAVVPQAAPKVFEVAVAVIAAHSGLGLGNARDEQFVREVYASIVHQISQKTSPGIGQVEVATQLKQDLEQVSGVPEALIKNWEAFQIPGSATEERKRAEEKAAIARAEEKREAEKAARAEAREREAEAKEEARIAAEQKAEEERVATVKQQEEEEAEAAITTEAEQKAVEEKRAQEKEAEEIQAAEEKKTEETITAEAKEAAEKIAEEEKAAEIKRNTEEKEAEIAAEEKAQREAEEKAEEKAKEAEEAEEVLDLEQKAKALAEEVREEERKIAAERKAKEIAEQKRREALAANPDDPEAQLRDPDAPDPDGPVPAVRPDAYPDGGEEGIPDARPIDTRDPRMPDSAEESDDPLDPRRPIRPRKTARPGESVALDSLASDEGSIEFVLYVFRYGRQPWWASNLRQRDVEALITRLVSERPRALVAATREMIEKSPRSEYPEIVNRIIQSLDVVVMMRFVEKLVPDMIGFMGTVARALEVFHRAKEAELSPPPHLSSQATFAWHYPIRYVFEYFSGSPNPSEMLRYVLRTVAIENKIAPREFIEEMKTLAEEALEEGERRFGPFKTMLPKPMQSLQVPTPKLHPGEAETLAAEAEAREAARSEPTAETPATPALEAGVPPVSEAPTTVEVDPETGEVPAAEQPTPGLPDSPEAETPAAETPATPEGETPTVPADQDPESPEQEAAALSPKAEEEPEAEVPEADPPAAPDPQSPTDDTPADPAGETATPPTTRPDSPPAPEAETDPETPEAEAEAGDPSPEAPSREEASEEEEEEETSREKATSTEKPAITLPQIIEDQGETIRIIRYYLEHGALPHQEAIVFTKEVFAELIREAFVRYERPMILMLKAIMPQRTVRMRMVNLGDEIAEETMLRINWNLGQYLQTYVHSIVELVRSGGAPISVKQLLEHAIAYVTEGKTSNFQPVVYLKELVRYMDRTYSKSQPEFVNWLIRKNEEKNVPVKAAMGEILEMIRAAVDRYPGKPPAIKQQSTSRYGNTPIPEDEEIFVENAGMVLIWPFLQQYFMRLNLMNPEKEFNDLEAQERAVHMLQYACTEEQNVPEEKLFLNKLLVGLPLDHPLQQSIDITEAEIETTGQMMRAVADQWAMMKGAPPEQLRQTFMIRDGNLKRDGDNWLLTVEKKGYDMVLKKLPWGLSMVRLPWLEFILNVDWS